MQRARTLTGLFLQVLRQRWSALGKRGRILFVALAVLVTAGAVHLTASALGGCSGGPCQLTSSPCHTAAAPADDDPCPYAARARRAAEAESE